MSASLPDASGGVPSRISAPSPTGGNVSSSTTRLRTRPLPSRPASRPRSAAALHRDLALRRLGDAHDGRVARLVDARLDAEHARQPDLELLDEPALELASRPSPCRRPPRSRSRRSRAGCPAPRRARRRPACAPSSDAMQPVSTRSYSSPLTAAASAVAVAIASPPSNAGSASRTAVAAPLAMLIRRTSSDDSWPERQDGDVAVVLLREEQRLLERVVVRLVDLKSQALLYDALAAGGDLEVGLGRLGHLLHTDDDVHVFPVPPESQLRAPGLRRCRRYRPRAPSPRVRPGR